MRSYLALLALALPWLNPVTYGPTLPVVQFLTVWVCAALCLVVCATARTTPHAGARLAASAWLLAAAASAAMALLQYAGWSADLAPWLNYADAGKAYANLRQRNQLATLLAIGLCALVWWQTQCQAQALSNPVASVRVAWKAGLGLCAVLLAAADAASGSRTGMLQLLVLAALALLWRRGRATLLLALMAYAAAAWLLPRLAGLDPLQSGILGRLDESAAPCSSRMVLWSNVLHLIAQKPWTGWGWGELAYAHFMTLYGGERFCEILGNAHNLPLHLAVELGIPVAVLVCGLALWLVLRARPWREPEATRQMAWGVLVVIGVHSLLEYPLWYAPFQLAALLALGLLAGPALARRVACSRGCWGATLALAVAVLLVCSYVAWDYLRISQIYLSESARDERYRDNTLEKIRPSWLFASQVQFAELGITPLARDNAEHIHGLAVQMLHFSPEASVAAKLIESASLLGQDDEAKAIMLRYKTAYPQEYAAWAAGNKALGSNKAP